MDTHITEMAHDEDPASLRRARVGLPGEGALSGIAPPEPLSAEPILKSSDDAPIRVDPGARFAAATPPRRRRWLLAGVPVVALGGAAVGFLLSPYNKIYPIDAARLQTQGRQMVASVRQRTVDLVAPAAKVAQASASIPKPGPRREVVVAPSPEAQLQEIIALHDGAAPQSPVPAATAPAAPVMAAATIAPAVMEKSALPVVPPPLSTSAVASRSMTPPPILASPALVPPQVLETGAGPVSKPGSLSAHSPPNMPAAAAALPVLAPLVQAQSVQTSPLVQPPAAAAVPPSAPLPANLRPTPGADFEPAIPVDAGLVVVAPHDSPPPDAVIDSNGPQTAPPVRRDAAIREVAPARRVLPDPVTVAAEIRAAPMTSPQQVEVLNVVAQLAIVVRDMRAENASLKSRVLSTAERFDTAVADFDRRLALAEAKGAINAAMGLDAAPSSATRPFGGAAADALPSAPNGMRPRPVTSRPPGVQIVAPDPVASPAGAVRYRVTAASPGLAMLALMDRSGGEGSQLQVAVGDQVPGYGRVTAIQQRGSSWMVQTDKGPDKGIIQ